MDDLQKGRFEFSAAKESRVEEDMTPVSIADDGQLKIAEVLKCFRRSNRKSSKTLFRLQFVQKLLLSFLKLRILLSYQL